MSTIELQQAIALTSHALRFFTACWAVFREQRERARLRTQLYDMSDLELRDIGITHGDIEYFASNRSVDRHVDRPRAFSREAHPGSRERNASKQMAGAPF